MLKTKKSAFDQIQPTVKGHFILYLYAAIYRLINHILELSKVGGPTVKATFKKYPFLVGYYTEIRKYMPREISWDEGARWWRQEIRAWEEKCDTYLPLRALANDQEIGFGSCLAFMAIGLVEEDSRFGVLFAELQAPLGQRRPALELVGRMMVSNGVPAIDEDSLAICGPLIRNGFVEVFNPKAARSEWVLRAPTLLWDAARGQIENHSETWLSYYKPESFPDLTDLIYTHEFIERLQNIPPLLDSGKVKNLVMRCDHGSDPLEVSGALAANLNSGLVVVEGQASADKDHLRLLGPFCAMTRSLPALRYDLGPGESIEPPALDGYNGPVFFILGFEGGLNSRKIKNSLTINLPFPNKILRKRYWQKALNGSRIEGLDSLSGMYHLSGSYIGQLADIALTNAGLNGRESVRLEDVQQASRSLNRQQLDTLADHLETQGSWNDLVTTTTTTDKLRELEQRCRYREKLLDHLGPAFRNSSNRGVRALFSGISGTGKTLAAKILASELEMDLYRVDLAAVINKYIGETEKNLHQVLSRAEALDVVLLLDEGDALLGTRTDVKTANDRYANLETNYLLQRLENYQGIVLVTTNLGENIDQAFQRRMDVVAPFFSPQPEERMRIMEIHLPADHLIEQEYLEQVALRCTLTGGQIRNATFHATLLALDEGRSVDKYHLEEALRGEFRKAGGTFPLSNNHVGDNDMDGGMGVFVDALRNH